MSRRTPRRAGWAVVVAGLTGLAACGRATTAVQSPALVGPANHTVNSGSAQIQHLDKVLNLLEGQLTDVQAQILGSSPYRLLAHTASLSQAKGALTREIAASHTGPAGCAAASQQESVVLVQVAAARSGLALLNAQTQRLQQEFARAQSLSAQVTATAQALQVLLNAHPAAGTQVDGDLLIAQLGQTHHEQVLGAGVARAVTQVQAEPAKMQRLTARAQYLGLACREVPTTVLLTSSFPAALVSESGQLLATVQVPTGSRPVQGGTVTFAAGGRSLSVVPVGMDGAARLPLTSLLFGASGLGAGAVGLLDVTATYSGDLYHAPSSANLAQGIQRIPTIIQATETITSPTAATGIRVLATIVNAAAVPAQPQSGTVTLSQGSSVLSTGPVGPQSHALLAARPMPAGSYPLTLTYSGDAFHTAASYTFTVVVAP